MTSGGWRAWIFGGGTALSSVQRDSTFLALEVGPSCYLIDCGASPYRRLLQAGLDPPGLRGVILTHAHADHIYGLPLLLFQLSLAGYSGMLAIYGLRATLQVAQQVVQAFDLGQHCAAHRWLEVRADAEGAVQDLFWDGGIQVQAGLVRHSRPTLGLRVQSGGGCLLAYSGDTEPCPGLMALARGAGWLLHECTVDRPFAGHSTPEDVAGVARDGGVGHLGIVHYDPAYGPGREDLVDRVRRAGFAGEIRILEDLDAIP
jgi:ribonuclease Z